MAHPMLAFEPEGLGDAALGGRLDWLRSRPNRRDRFKGWARALHEGTSICRSSELESDGTVHPPALARELDSVTVARTVSSFVSRGFTGRRRTPEELRERLPPGQCVESGFSVLTADPTPYTEPWHTPKRGSRWRRI